VTTVEEARDNDGRRHELVEALTAALLSAEAYRRWHAHEDGSPQEAREALRALLAEVERVRVVAEGLLGDSA
jgi:hypothetical protein